MASLMYRSLQNAGCRRDQWAYNMWLLNRCPVCGLMFPNCRHASKGFMLQASIQRMTNQLMTKAFTAWVDFHNCCLTVRSRSVRERGGAIIPMIIPPRAAYSTLHLPKRDHSARPANGSRPRAASRGRKARRRLPRVAVAQSADGFPEDSADSAVAQVGYVLEFVTASTSRIGSVASVLCTICGNRGSNIFRCTNVFDSEFVTDVASQFRCVATQSLGAIVSIVLHVEFTDSRGGATWAPESVSMTRMTEMTTESTGSQSTGLRVEFQCFSFNREQCEHTLYPLATGAQARLPDPEELSSSGQSIKYELCLRIRVVSTKEVEVPLSLVIRGERGQHTTLLEATSRGGNSPNAIQLSENLECQSFGKILNISVGDWAGTCKRQTAEPVHVYVEHFEIRESESNVPSRLYFHRWLPPAGQLKAVPEAVDHAVFDMINDTSPDTDRIWVITLLTGDANAIRALAATKWKRETPTITMSISSASTDMFLDLPLLLKFIPFDGDR